LQLAKTLVLYYITDRSQFPGDEVRRRGLLLAKIADAARAGVDFIQLREKDLAPRELEQLARDAVHAIRKASPSSRGSAIKQSTHLLINSRTDVALACGADGVHLRSIDVSARDARNVASSALRAGQPSREWLVAVSCHSVEDVHRAASDSADFAVLAPVFEKKGDSALAALGLRVLEQACKMSIPVIALGGITLENTSSCLKAGAAGISGIRLFQDHDIPTAVEKLRQSVGR